MVSVTSATIPHCRRYRYDLERKTSKGAGSVLWIMLNPSTADATKNDPTIRKCIGFTGRWGFAQLKVVNLFAWRATDPKHLRGIPEVIDVENIRVLLNEMQVHDRVVFAWGGGLKNAKGFEWMAEYVTRIFFDAVCLGINGDGTPKHPLYVSYEVEPVPYTHAKHFSDQCSDVVCVCGLGQRS